MSRKLKRHYMLEKYGAWYYIKDNSNLPGPSFE